MYGGNGETRTHTAVARPSVFKTAAARPTRLTFPWRRLLDLNQRSHLRDSVP